MIYWADRKMYLPRQKHFFSPTKEFCQTNRTFLLHQQKSFVRLTKRPNKKILLAQRNIFVAQITTKLFCCVNKILVGQANRFLIARETLPRKMVKIENPIAKVYHHLGTFLLVFLIILVYSLRWCNVLVTHHLLFYLFSTIINPFIKYFEYKCDRSSP